MTSNDSISLVPIGPIVRLQVQTAPLKLGEKPRRWYDPAPLRAVPALRLDDGGATGLDDGEWADVHHRDHPLSRFSGANGLSVGFTAHYAAMRERFGAHLVNGIAGEAILVETNRPQAAGELAGGLVIGTRNGPVALADVQVAAPCVEFSKFCAGYPGERKADRAITETLQFLHAGMRGYYATLGVGEQGTATVSLGDMVYRVTARA